MTQFKSIALITAACAALLLIYRIPSTTRTTPIVIDKAHLQSYAVVNDSLFRSTADEGDNTKETVNEVCYNIPTSERDCKKVKVEIRNPPSKFPLQFVAGTPGSGNDWILWLASLNQDYSCEIYNKLKLSYHVWIGSTDAKLTNAMKKMRGEPSECLFYKSHEPWFAKSPLAYNSSIKATLLLRHPYDAALAEYKRKLVSEKGKSDLKNSVEGITVDSFFNLASNSPNPAYMSHLWSYAAMWSRHMHYWLNTYTGPLHVMIYGNVKEDAAREIEEMQRFFGYQFDDDNVRDHCCKMKYTTKATLKRKKSEVDTYKEMIYQNLGGVRLKFDALVKETNSLLAERYPKNNLTLDRG